MNMKQMAYSRSWEGGLGNHLIGTLCLSDAEQDVVRHRKALERARMYRERGAEGTALMQLGDAYLRIGEIECAIECYHEQLTIARELEYRYEEGVALNNLGNAYANLRNRRRAMQYYRDYLALAILLGDERAQAIANWNIGMVYREKGNLTQAVAFVHEGVEGMRRTNYIVMWSTMRRISII